MVCYKPQLAWRSQKYFTSTGKQKILFNANRLSGGEEELMLKCGQCVGCRLARSREWALRCMHEASLHDANCFVTLTYSNENLPKSWSLEHRDWQLFAKRMRAAVGSFRFYMCGEYGDEAFRPHYHACIFGYDFPDKTVWKKNSNGDKLYISETLNNLWGLGYAVIGDVTFQSAAYVARYVMKKRYGDAAKDHYSRHDPKTGVIFDLKPEYTAMSRNPGIAHGWINKFVTDVYPGDFVVDSSGKKHSPPKYYDRQYELLYPEDFEFLKQVRVENAKKHIDNNTPERLEVRERIQCIKLEKLKRNHDKG